MTDMNILDYIEKVAMKSKALDDHPALKGKQKTALPDKVQAMIIKKKMEKKASKRHVIGEIPGAVKDLVKGYRNTQKTMRSMGLPEEIISTRASLRSPIKSRKAMLSMLLTPKGQLQFQKSLKPNMDAVQKVQSRFRKALNK